MTSVPIKDLKENLSEWTEKAFRGEVIQITKYNRPYVTMAPAQSAKGVVQGLRVGEGFLTSAIRKGTGGKVLKFLQEDREEAS